MFIINLENLNELEKSINQTLIREVKQQKNLRISEAALLCNVSTSKISKFVKKLGFQNYKDYLSFISGAPKKQQPAFSSELLRVKNFIDNFDTGVVDAFVEQVSHYDKIILFGYGPTFICLEYFEYKLRLVVDKNIITLSNESLLDSLLTDSTLLIIFSVTGKFSDFTSAFTLAEAVSAKVLLILEEYNKDYKSKNADIFYLTKSFQDENLLPYEKTRTIFFLFIEEVIRKFDAINKKAAENS